MIFNPRDRDMGRPRSQVLYRFRPHQTFDHVGGYTAQVRQFGADVAFEGVELDDGYLVDEALRFVARWRREGRLAGAADRAPEFPDTDLPLAHKHFEVVIPGKVFCRVWPRVVRCSRPSCGMVWEAADPRPGVDEWPPACPKCATRANNRQLQFVFAHQCGELRGMLPPRECPRCHQDQFRLNDRVSRFKDFRWECLNCRHALTVQQFCRSSCTWPEKRMAPLVHTASSAYIGHGITLVNPPTSDFADRSRQPSFVLANLGRWLGELNLTEYEQLLDGPATQSIPAAVLDSIQAMEEAGLAEQAQALRTQFMPVDTDALRERLRSVLGYEPLGEDERGQALARNLAAYHQVLRLTHLKIEDLEEFHGTDRYRGYRPTLRRTGFDPDATALVGDFPMTYIALGYSRNGYGPTEADLVPFKGRSSKGQALTNLIYANPTETEALVLALDIQRVERWLATNLLVSSRELSNSGGVRRWFASQLDPHDGQRPDWGATADPDDREHPTHAAQALFRLLHSVAHQVLRAVAVDSGFSETSLSEYLFPYELALAIHPNGGSEFTIGGLRTVFEQNLSEILHRALDNTGCLYDPHCLVTNRGVDHGCLQLPETACQFWNRELSRWELFGSPSGEVVGYWDPELN